MAKKIEIGDNLGFFLLMLAMVILVIFASPRSWDEKGVKAKAVVIKVPENRKENYKVKFIDDGSVDIMYLKKGYSVGDTILIRK